LLDVVNLFHSYLFVIFFLLYFFFFFFFFFFFSSRRRHTRSLRDWSSDVCSSDLFLIFIALFVYIGASQEAALAQMKDVSRRFPGASAMVREFRTLSESGSLQEAIDALLATSQHDFPVVDETGNVTGLLTRNDLIAALRKNDPSLRVGDVMRRDIPTVTTGT